MTITQLRKARLEANLQEQLSNLALNEFSRDLSKEATVLRQQIKRSEKAKAVSKIYKASKKEKREELNE
jgi:hypothetical protein